VILKFTSISYLNATIGNSNASKLIKTSLFNSDSTQSSF